MTLPVLQNYVNGRLVKPRATATVEVINPATEEPVALMPLSTPEDVDDAVQAAAEAFKSWRRTTPAERQTLLNKLADAIEARAEELVEAQHRNTGQPRSVIREDEVGVAVDHLRFFAGAARVLEGIGAGEYAEGLTSYVRREPLGVVAQITPWNYPVFMAIWKIAPALAAGDTIVLKPAHSTPESAVVLAEIAGTVLPPGVFNVVVGSGVTGPALVAHPIPALVSITGSTRAGKEVAKTAAETLKVCHLELGGKAPAVVFADADLDAAAEGIAAAGLFNAGQDCTASCRVLVEASVADEFTAKLVAQAREFKTGDAEDPDAFYGPLNNAKHFAKVMSYIDELPAHAKIETGGHRIGSKGFYVEPTVISGVRQTDAIVQEEVFGPVITVQSFDDADQAVALANDVEFGLASSVWTGSHSTALKFSRELDFGTVWINTHIPLVAEFPHGGFKASGYGKDLSHYALEEYTRVKHVMSAE
ncbi:MAG: gamma-aminobutyraldehyde dehydrogenase [Bifidobacteriaceae bacterium]|jgi:aldehyde dehydrogenase (NAD+)|nr:gamma-aminobutyraldehyde dehydrogenase [Bifidobacteriaceae bacterium]